MAEIYHHHPYFIGADTLLTESQRRQMAACFESAGKPPEGILGGRAAVLSVDLSGIGPVIIKQYTRGGLLRYINRQTYVKLSRYRCEVEFFLLKYLASIGVNAPEPVAFAYELKYAVKYASSFLYHAWIVTREIENAVTLARLSIQDPDRARAAMEDLIRQVHILVENNIHHVDLHPGNVLVDPKDKVFFIDFDKAGTRPQNREQLRGKYIKRWRRAVVKHHLPEEILIPEGFHFSHEP